jgi:tetratricopeptide (TPR) repeat protein
MSPENWRRVNTIYEEALEKHAEEREQFLHAACTEDPPEVRAKVEELLWAPEEEEGGLFDQVRRRVAAVLSPEPLSEPHGCLDKAPPDLPDDYEVLTPSIGERDGWPKVGGMGEVWRVRDLQFQRTLAVKVLRAALSADPRQVCRFLAEARITGQLAHPSIVPVQALGLLPDGRPYYTMKLVEGQTLGERLREARPELASRRMELLQVFARICQAMAFAHSKGVIHRDLKTANVMVGKHGEVQLMDFGVAKVFAHSGIRGEEEAQTSVTPDETDDQTQPGSVMGTWEYMPPEQANGRTAEIGRRCDVFGLGAILCAILTGRPPYVGDTKDDVKRQAIAADLAGAYARLKGCGAEAKLIALTRECLSPDPCKRPEDASVVEKRLADYLTSVEKRLRDEQEARRRLLWGAAGAALLLVVLSVAAFFAWRDHEAREKHVADTIDRALMTAMGGDLEGAEPVIAQAEQEGASPGQVHMLRGQIALHRGQSSEARRHLEEAVRLLPQSVAARGMLAAAHADDGHWERYDQMMREMQRLPPLTPEDFLYKGYAESNLDPERGLQTIKEAFDRRPMMGTALLVRAEVRALVAQDKDRLAEAEGALRDAGYARELLRDNPASLWVSLNAHLVKAGVHKHRRETEKRRAELELAGKDADDLQRFAEFPEAVVSRWLYYREMDREEEVLGELRRASEQTDHVYATFCCALTLYRRGQPGDLEEALRVLQKRPGTYNDRLLPFVLAEHDYQPDKHDWQARARQTLEDFTARCQDGAAVMDAQAVLCLLGEKAEAVKASQKLQKEPARFYTLRREPIWRCLRYNAGDLSADDLLQGAQGSRWNECLAHHYVAMTKLADGDRIGAKEHFDQVVETRATLWGTYDMSWVFRDRLAKDHTWPPWIPEGRAK